MRENFTQRANAVGPFEFFVFDFEVGRDAVEQAPVAVKVLIQTIALSVPLFTKQAVGGLDVLNSERDCSSDGRL